MPSAAHEDGTPPSKWRVFLGSYCARTARPGWDSPIEIGGRTWDPAASHLGRKHQHWGNGLATGLAILKNPHKLFLLSICSSVQFRYIPSRHCLSSKQQAYPTIICTLYFLIHLSFHQLVSFIRCCFLNLDCTQVFYFLSGNAFFFVFILFFCVLFFGGALPRNCTVFL